MRVVLTLAVLAAVSRVYSTDPGLIVDRVEKFEGKTVTYYQDGTYLVEMPGDGKTAIYKCDKNKTLYLFGTRYDDGRLDQWVDLGNGTWIHQYTYLCSCRNNGGRCSVCGGAGSTSAGYFSIPCTICKGTGACQQQHDSKGFVMKYDVLQGRPAMPTADYSVPSSSSSSSVSSSKKLCAQCNGTGSCPQCYGKGWYTNKYSGVNNKCEMCPNGNGKCWKCHGEGYVH